MRLIGLVLALGLVLVSFLAEAQRAGKVHRLGYLLYDSSRPSSSFVQGLHELGYVADRDFIIEYRSAEGDAGRLPHLAADLLRSGVDVIVTQGTAATFAAKQATRTVPIVFASAGFPVEKGLVASLARPGENVTGLAIFVGDGKALELLKEATPRIARVVHLYDAATVQPTEYLEMSLKQWEGDAQALNVRLQSIALRRAGDVGQAFEVFERGTNGLILDNAGLVLTNRRDICRMALERRLPAVGRGRPFADAGCLGSYGEDIRTMYRRAASLVDKILKGAKPADLPVEQATKFELVINLKTAKALGLTIPQSLLLRADQIIE